MTFEKRVRKIISTFDWRFVKRDEYMKLSLTTPPEDMYDDIEGYYKRLETLFVDCTHFVLVLCLLIEKPVIHSIHLSNHLSSKILDRAIHLYVGNRKLHTVIMFARVDEGGQSLFILDDKYQSTNQSIGYSDDLRCVGILSDGTITVGTLKEWKMIYLQKLRGSDDLYLGLYLISRVVKECHDILVKELGPQLGSNFKLEDVGVRRIAKAEKDDVARYDHELYEGLMKKYPLKVIDKRVEAYFSTLVDTSPTPCRRSSTHVSHPST